MTPCFAVWPELAIWLGGKLKVGFTGIRYAVRTCTPPHLALHLHLHLDQVSGDYLQIPMRV